MVAMAIDQQSLDHYPRLTNVLRVIGKGDTLDAESLFVSRRQALEARRRSRQGQGRGREVPEAASLKRLLFQSSWDSAPKAARVAYDTFLTSVLQLLAAEVPSAELQAAALAAWQALLPLGEPEAARGRGPVQLLLGPHKSALSAALGPGLDLSATQPLVAAAMALRKALGGGVGGVGGAQQAGALQAAPSPPRGAQEWGGQGEWEREGGQGGVQQALRASGLMALHRSGTAGSQPGPPGVGAAPSPAELQAMVRGAAGRSFTLLPAAQPGGQGESEGEEELGEEYEEGKRLRQVGPAGGQAAGGTRDRGGRLGLGINLHWLQRWAQRTTGFPPDCLADLCESLATVLLLSAGGGQGALEEAAGQLLELVGQEAAEAVAQLMQQRRLVLGALQLALAKIREDEERQAAQPAMPAYGSQAGRRAGGGQGGAGGGQGGAGGGQGGGRGGQGGAGGGAGRGCLWVTINSSSQKLQAKLQRKEAKRGAKASKQGGLGCSRGGFRGAGLRAGALPWWLRGSGSAGALLLLLLLLVVVVAGDADLELLQAVGWEAVLDTERDHSATWCWVRAGG
ncbi:hypothetical protein V8C86DRAFT_3151858 [Haematococcus lacustris]